MQRYQWERPGDLMHIDIKLLARIQKVGHRITGDRQQGRSYGVGYNKGPRRRRCPHTAGVCRGAGG
jgi:hypothetical protein